MASTSTSRLASVAGWRTTIRVEPLAYGLVALVALLLRAVQLGHAPLSTGEAGQALAALRFVEDGIFNSRAIHSPLAFAGTALSMALFGATDAAARLVSMLAGVGLALTPGLFRRELGRSGALIAATWLAISPVAVGASRRLNGVTLAMLALLVALAATRNLLAGRSRRYAVVTGAALAAAWLADHGAFAVALALLAGGVFAFITDEEDLLTRNALRAAAGRVPWGTFAATFAGAFVLLATLFFAAPRGLGAGADQLGRFLTGFVEDAPGVSPIIALLVYDPGLVIFGFIGAWRTTQSPLPWQRVLAGWAIAATLLTIVYRGAAPEHALWAVVPLAGLAALAVRDLFAWEDDAPRSALFGFALAILALVAMSFASLTHYLTAPRVLPIPPSGTAAVSLPVDLLLVGLWAALLVILWFSAASLWQPRLAWHSTGLAGLVLAGMIAVGQSGALAFFRPDSPAEPLNAAPAQAGLTRLVQTAEEISDFTAGHEHAASVTVQAEPGSALAWALRDFDDLTLVSRVDPTVSAELVVTPVEGVDPALGSSYVGQDFVIEARWQPRNLSFSDALRWLIYRTTPVEPTQMRAILWVREDVYRLVPAGGEPAQP